MDAYEEFLKKIQEGLQRTEEDAQNVLPASQCGGAQPLAARAGFQQQQQPQVPLPEVQQTQRPASPSFKVLYEDICQRIRSSGTLDDIMRDFQDLNTDLERVKYVSQLTEIKTMNLEENYSRKIEEDASNYEKVYDMLISNEASASKALEVMRKCVQKTPAQDVTTLAVRYMKRGWASLLLEQFEDAKIDAKKSLTFNCPEELLWNSFEILGYCSAREHDNKAAETYFLKSLENLRKSNTVNEVKATVTVRIMTVFKTVKAKKNKKGSKTQLGEVEVKAVVPEVSYGPHKRFPSASSALDFIITEDRGRCTIAKKDIKPGDILIVDTPYCTMMNPEHLSSHCYQCYTRCHTPVPCNSCAKVSYCSEGCRAASWSGLHHVECCVLDHLIDPGIGKMALLAYRLGLTSSPHKVYSCSSTSILILSPLTEPATVRTTLTPDPLPHIPHIIFFSFFT
ncbi:SET and MYND domain-containing protein 4-like 3, partial [Homarus americanus]